MEIQLRDYRVQPGKMDEWISGWRAGVVPLCEEFGFRLLGAWVDRSHDRFVWVLGYAGADGFQAANERYYASEQRNALSPEPSVCLAETQLVMVDAVP